MYRLAEQGLAPKRVLFVTVPLVIIFLMEQIKRVFKRKGDKAMGKKQNTFDALIVNLDYLISLNCNVAGGALLANVF